MDKIERGLDIATDYDRFSAEIIDAVMIRTGRRGGRVATAEFYDTADAEEFLSRNSRKDIPIKINARLDGARTVYLRFHISWPGNSSRRPDRREDERRRTEGWLCYECNATVNPDRTYCFRCKVERPPEVHQPQVQDYGPILTGETDQDPQQMPSQYVVIRGLDSAVDEEVLAKGLEQLYVESAAPTKDASDGSAKPKLKSTAPTRSTTGLGARPQSLRRVFLMRDRKTDVTWKYGFAEFATIADAQGAVAKFHGMERFRINSKPVFVAFIHAGVFVPAAGLADEGPFSFVPIYNPGLLLKYWDDRGYPSALTVSEPSDTGDGEKADAAYGKSAGNGTRSREAQSARDILKKVKKDVTARERKPAIMAPQVQMWARKRAELHEGQHSADDRPVKRDPPKTKYGLPRQLSAALGSERRHSADETAEDGERAAHGRDTIASYGLQSTPDGPYTCVLCPGSEDFADAQALMDHHALDAAHSKALLEADQLAKAEAALAAKDATKSTVRRRQPRLRSQPAPDYISYADRVHLVCLVCSPPRRFTNKHVLRLHETESVLHKDSLADPDKVAKAERRLATLGQRPRLMKPKAQSSGARSEQAYRDRARERRIAFSQRSKPKPDNGAAAAAGASKGKDDDDDDAAADSGAAEKAAGKKPSKGAALLGKMGWAAGSGLGAEGTGRTDIIASELYVPGVGLGAAGGKAGDAAEEAARNTKGEFSDFVQKTRDKARERYERLG
jgi:RNA-binding protein 5/10